MVLVAAFVICPVRRMHTRNAAIKVFQMKLLSLPVSKTEDLDGAFDKILKERPGALLVLADRVFLHNRNRIMEFATKNRLPTMLPYKELVEAGG